MQENDLTLLLDEKLKLFTMLMRRLNCPPPMEHGPRGASQDRALKLIAENDGISQRLLADCMNLMPSSMSELITKLENGGLIKRMQNDYDRRNVNIYLTENGKRYFENPEMRPSYPEPSSPFNSLTPEEQETLLRLLDKLTNSASIECGRRGIPMRPERPPFERRDDRFEHGPRPRHLPRRFEEQGMGNPEHRFNEEFPDDRPRRI